METTIKTTEPSTFIPDLEMVRQIAGITHSIELLVRGGNQLQFFKDDIITPEEVLKVFNHSMAPSYRVITMDELQVILHEIKVSTGIYTVEKNGYIIKLIPRPTESLNKINLKEL